MRRLATSRGLLEALQAEGHALPADCQEVEIIMRAQGLITLRYTCSVYGPTLARVGRALARLGSEGGDVATSPEQPVPVEPSEA